MKHLLAIVLLLVSGIAAADSATNTFETTLKNGLKVIVKEDHRAPTAVQMVWYKVGSMDEVDGSSGLAHALEHMMFKGTPKIGPGEFNKRVSAAGGKDNAFTSHDFTAYFQQVPKESLADMMQLEADRMRHLSVSAKEFDPEIKVIMEERRMRTDDNPQAKLFEQMNAVAWQAHPYRRPIIGWMNDLEQMTAADAKDWYERWYVPNNATLIVIGDVDHQAVFQLAEQYYGLLEGRALPQRRPQIEPEQIGERRIRVKAPAELPMLVLGYKAPVIRDVEKDSDPYALEMLAAILDGYDAARLHKRLIREQKIAISADVGYDSIARGPGMFFLMAIPAEGRSMGELESALKGEITRIQKEGISEAELKRAKAQLEAAQTYKLDSMFGQAMEIGQAEVVGLSHRDNTRMIAKAQQVTAAQVQAVAKKYFSDDSLTVGILDPQPLDKAPRRPSVPTKH